MEKKRRKTHLAKERLGRQERNKEGKREFRSDRIKYEKSKMQVENVDKFWDPSANRNIKGPRGRRIAGKYPHMVLWGSLMVAYLYFSRYRSDTTGVFRAPPPPCEAPPAYREALAIETTFEQPHLRRLEVENALPSHVPPRKGALRDFAAYQKNPLESAGK